MVTFLSVYAPQSGLSDEDKDLFFDQLLAVTGRIPKSEFLILCGDWNGHVGRAVTEYREVHGGMGTTDAIFVVRQLQEKYLAANKRLYMAFIDLEKAFDRVPRKVFGGH